MEVRRRAGAVRERSSSRSWIGIAVVVGILLLAAYGVYLSYLLGSLYARIAPSAGASEE